jgi:D-arabinose 1-dehydrogenase-like Zn-dependent alcohol dehydrogenase
MVKDGVFEWAGSKPPMTGSHEAVGTVHAVGSGVEGFQNGDRIGAINLLHPCSSSHLSALNACSRKLNADSLFYK